MRGGEGKGGERDRKEDKRGEGEGEGRCVCWTTGDCHHPRPPPTLNIETATLYTNSNRGSCGCVGHAEYNGRAGLLLEILKLGFSVC